MDIPLVNEGGGSVGTNPRFKKDAGIPGGQGSIHFSIRADPTNSTVVYVGGDRQPRGLNDAGSFPNALGANNFTGRLFRGDASVTATGAVPSPQWKHLTHTQNAGGMTGGGTASNSAPHADSREMVFDANGDLIQVDDGGIYRRTSPANNTGDWFSINGDIQVGEPHSVAYDTLSNIIVTGNQDTGASQQSASGSVIWDEISQGDGGDVAITLNPSNSAQSIRYTSAQFLGNNPLWRSVYSASGVFVSRTFPALSPLGGDPAMTGQFYTPLEANVIDGNRLLFGGANGVYESLNQGSSISRVSTSVVNSSLGNPMVYGGRSGGVDNADLIYVAQNSGILRRTTSGGSLTSVGGYGGGTVRGLIADPEEWMTLFAIDNDQVFMTVNAGTNFTEITGDLPNVELRSIEIVGSGGSSALIVGTGGGVYAAVGPNFNEWALLGTGLPNGPTFDMQYDPADDLLVVSVLGRGAWTFPTVSNALFNNTFEIAGTPSSLSICAPDDAVFGVNVVGFGGFTDPVTLSASGNPAGTTVSFSPNPVMPGSSSTMTIGNTSGVATGSYTLEINGNSGATDKTSDVSLSVFSAVPEPVTLLFPAKGQTGVALIPTFSWVPAALPVPYTLEVDDDPAFGSIEFTGTTSNPMLMLDIALDPDTLYYWRVTVQNPCGSSLSTIGTFLTRFAPARSPNLGIPDGNPTGISDDLLVTDTRKITDLDVAIQITHSYVGDLTVTLTHVDTGTSVVLIDRPGVPASTFGSSGNNIDIILNDEASLVVENDWSTGEPAYLVGEHYQPNNLLSAFDGECMEGTWRLSVTDSATPDPGTLVNWSLRSDAGTFYQYWTAQSGISGANADLDADANSDGVPNGIAFVLGAANANADALSLLPMGTIGSGNDFIFTYRQADIAAHLDPFAEYAADLLLWERATDGDDGVEILIMDDGFGPGIDRVQVTIPDSLAPDGRIFGRVNASTD